MYKSKYEVNSESLLDKKLLQAVEDGDVKMAEYCLHKGANINAKITHYTNLNGYVPTGNPISFLHYAAKLNHKEMTKFLIEKGLDVNISSDGNDTPLHYATWNNSAEAAKVLLEKGADDFYNTNPANGGKNMLQDAILFSAIDIIKLLCENNKELVNYKNSEGEGPLHEAIYEAQNQSTFEAQVEASSKLENIADTLIKNGADVNAKNKLGETPLHYAVFYDYPNMVDFLVDKGADVNAETNEKGQTPLYFAVRERLDPEVTSNLLKNGADPLIKDKWGDTIFDFDEGYTEGVVRNYNKENPDKPISLPVSSSDNMEK